MKKVGVITDSHSGISQKKAEELGILVLPMPFFLDGKCYYEDKDLTREQFFEMLDSGVAVSTSQPTPEEVMEIWDKGLEQFEEIVYIPISSGLSGACNTAIMLAQEEPYEGKVYVVDNGRVSTPMYRSVLDALDMIDKGYDAAFIKKSLEDARDKMSIYVGVDTLKHLKEGGRINAATALLGSVLNVKPILKFDVGLLESYKSCRGMGKAKKEMIAALKQDLETKFKEWYDKGEVYLLAASSASEKETQDWVKQIEEAFPGMEVMLGDISFGVSCHVGYGGLGIGCSCKPKYEGEL